MHIFFAGPFHSFAGKLSFSKTNEPGEQYSHTDSFSYRTLYIACNATADAYGKTLMTTQGFPILIENQGFLIVRASPAVLTRVGF